MSDKPKQPRRPKVIYRFAGCGACLKPNKVPVAWTRYICGHCGARIDATVEQKETRKLYDSE